MSDRVRSSISAVVLLCGAASLLLYLYHRARAFAARRGCRPLPPGPRPLPVLGNLLDIPKRHPWRGYKEYSKQYGTVYSPWSCPLILTTPPSQERSYRSEQWDRHWSLSTIPTLRWNSSRSGLPSIHLDPVRLSLSCECILHCQACTRLPESHADITGLGGHGILR